MQNLKTHLKLAITVVLFLCAVVGVRNLVNPAGRNGVVMAATATSCCSGVPFPPALSATSCCSGVPFPPAVHAIQAEARTSCCSGVPFPPAYEASAATSCCSGVPFPPAMTKRAKDVAENRNGVVRIHTRHFLDRSKAAGVGNQHME